MRCKDESRIQYFNGIRFVCTDGRYFVEQKHRIAMHRYVWEYYNGPIPEGYVIHHKDKNKANNDISNLECIPRGKHSRLHGAELTQEEREWRRNNLNTNARPKAVEWHKSEEGKQWHKEQALKQFAEGKTYFQKVAPECRICEVCGKEFYKKPLKNKTAQHHFCSEACHQKYRRTHKLGTMEKECPICGKIFLTNKYSPALTCSHSCANKLRWQEGGCFYDRKKEDK